MFLLHIRGSHHPQPSCGLTSRTGRVQEAAQSWLQISWPKATLMWMMRKWGWVKTYEVTIWLGEHPAKNQLFHDRIPQGGLRVLTHSREMLRKMTWTPVVIPSVTAMESAAYPRKKWINGGFRAYMFVCCLLWFCVGVQCFIFAFDVFSGGVLGGHFDAKVMCQCLVWMRGTIVEVVVFYVYVYVWG